VAFIENQTRHGHIDVVQLAADAFGFRTGQGVVVEYEVDPGRGRRKEAFMPAAVFNQRLQPLSHFILLDLDRSPFDFRYDCFLGIDAGS
jgi:hypothetical protein